MKTLPKKWLIVGFGVVAMVLALGMGGKGGGVALAQSPQPTPKPAAMGQNFMAALAQRLNLPADTLQQTVKDAAKDTVKRAADAGKLTTQQAEKLDTLIEAGKLPQIALALHAKAAKARRGHATAGEITAINGATLTLHNKKGNVTVQTNDDTAYRVAGKDHPTLADVHVKDHVAVFGDHQADGSLLAKYIAVKPATPKQ